METPTGYDVTLISSIMARFIYKKMSFIYTRADLKQRMNSGIHGKIGMLIDSNETVNRAVRQYTTDIDARSLRRRQALVPNLYNGIYDYACPSDLDAMKIIDIPAQAKRQDGEFFLVPTTEFATKRQRGMIAIKDYNGVRALQINSQVDSNTLIISELDEYDGDGLWEAFGDAEFIGSDDSDFIKGQGSVVFDINADGGTTAGIFNTDLTSIDLSDYLGGTSSVFVWVKIESITGLTNYKLRLGNSTSSYYTITVTTQSDGTAFVVGWNLLKFDLDFSVISETVIPVDETDITYAAIYMTKLGSKVSEADYKFDWLVVKKGVIHNVEYYSKFGWQSSAGAYKENSTDDADVLVADKDEYEIIIEAATKLAAREVSEYDTAKDAADEYDKKTKKYQMTNPSHAMVMTSEYYTYNYNDTSEDTYNQN